MQTKACPKTTSQRSEKRKQVACIIVVLGIILTVILVLSTTGIISGEVAVLLTAISTVLSVIQPALEKMEEVFERRQAAAVQPGESVISATSDPETPCPSTIPQPSSDLADPAPTLIPTLTPVPISAPAPSSIQSTGLPPAAPSPHPSVEDPCVQKRLNIQRSRDRGVIVVWLDSNAHCSTLSISHGYNPGLAAFKCKCANVERYGDEWKVAIFRSVSPGPYTLAANNLKRTHHIDVEPNHIMEVDWTRSNKGAK